MFGGKSESRFFAALRMREGNCHPEAKPKDLCRCCRSPGTTAKQVDAIESINQFLRRLRRTEETTMIIENCVYDKTDRIVLFRLLEISHKYCTDEKKY